MLVLADGPLAVRDVRTLVPELRCSTLPVVALRFGASSRFARSASTPSASSTASATSSTTSSASIGARRRSRGSTSASVGWSGSPEPQRLAAVGSSRRGRCDRLVAEPLAGAHHLGAVAQHPWERRAGPTSRSAR
jgi:hypothetical protein